MNYTITEGNIIRVYNVVYDKEKIEELLNKIVRECSYKVKGIFRRDYYGISYKTNPFRLTKRPKLPNVDIFYQELTDIATEITDWGLYYPGCDPDVIIIEGAEIIAPKLASIVASILKGDIESLNLLQAYKDDVELISNDAKLNEKIEESRKIINANEVDVDKLIEISDELKELRNKQKENQYFNVDLLKHYYLEVINSISYELVSETIKSRGPVKKLSMSEMFDKKAK